jgi:hypothetical protein
MLKTRKTAMFVFLALDLANTLYQVQGSIISFPTLLDDDFGMLVSKVPKKYSLCFLNGAVIANCLCGESAVGIATGYDLDG